MYNSYFGFSESPFSVTPDPRFFYTNPVYLEAFAALRYGVETKKGFIVITGEVGTGKTTLLRKLLHSLEDTVHSVFIFNTNVTFSELLRLTLRDLGLAPKDQDKVTMLQELNDYLIKQLKQGHTVTLLIDEAQNLSDEVLENLRLLSNLETDQEKLIQIVLTGQPELRAKLAQTHLRQLKQRIALQCKLSPLQAKEVGPYIESRLKAAGYNGKDLFHLEAVERIAVYSNGIPRVMNIICDNALLYAYATSQHTVSAEMIEEAARDLGLRSETSADDTSSSGAILAPRAGQETFIRRILGNRLHTEARSLTRNGVGIFLAVSFLIAVASIIASQQLLSVAGKRLELFKYNLNLWIAPVSRSQAVQQRPNTDVRSKPQTQRIVIQRGSTIQKIAAETYGPNAILGMDLIKEFNPQIQNLNWVFPGQHLLLPPLNQKTLLRQQPDGSYRLIAAGFLSRAEADVYGRALRDKGYRVTITPNRVSDDLVLLRVQIDGLKNLDEARQTWVVGLSNEWFTFPEDPSGGIQLTKTERAY